MVDIDTITALLTALGQYVDELEQYRRLSYDEFVATTKHYWAVEHGLQMAIRALLDVGSHILAAETAHPVEEYRDIIVALGKEGILPPAFAGRILGMAGFRNILVHRYRQVNLREVYDHLQSDLDDFRLFARYVTEWLAKKGYPVQSKP